MIKLLENTDINEHVIKPMEGKQPSYEPIYTLSSVILEIFKTYIQTYIKLGLLNIPYF